MLDTRKQTVTESPENKMTHSMASAHTVADVTASVKHPKASVIVPVYNDVTNLRRCLPALLKTVYEDFEIIIVDDSSSDDTPKVAQQFGVRVISLPENSGPGIARNCGAQAALGEYLIFIDADVCVSPSTVSRFVEAFERDPTVGAVFGSYDTDPPQRNALSQYKNLMHHFVHQEANPDAGTFWAGCGAVKRDVFLDLQGFSTSYRRPSIEDIEFGMRLRKEGYKVQIDKSIQVKHLKRWTLWSMTRTDIVDRAIPWTMLILNNRNLPNDLNLKFSQRISALMSGALLAVYAVGIWHDPKLALLSLLVLGVIIWLDWWSYSRRVPHLVTIAGLSVVVGIGCWLAVQFHFWLLIPVGLALGILLLNFRLFLLFGKLKRRQVLVVTLPLLVFYYLYSGLTFTGCVVYRFLQSCVQRVLRSLQVLNGKLKAP